MYLRLKNITLDFDPLGKQQPILASINIEVPQGGFVSIVGSSGSGKSSILNLVAGLLEPTGGEIVINGKPNWKARENRKIGFIFQQPVLFGWRNVLENIQLPGEILRKQEIQDKAHEFIRLVGLEGYEKFYPHELSGGMQSRVSIARALSHHPDLLLMDEPFADLDELTRERMNIELLRIWKKTGTTIVFVTHSINEAAFLSDTVHVLGDKPAKVVESIKIPLSRPRSISMLDDLNYTSLVNHIRRTLRAHTVSSFNGN
ncbi:MAG: sulfonate ABC transporter ATP-binding protein [Desulfotalea sp.]|nr:MAG: sulfonate ABC transporter ATP-binding protein [Desulfotalea sp.]